MAKQQVPSVPRIEYWETYTKLKYKDTDYILPPSLFLFRLIRLGYSLTISCPKKITRISLPASVSQVFCVITEHIQITHTHDGFLNRLIYMAILCIIMTLTVVTPEKVDFLSLQIRSQKGLAFYDWFRCLI